MDLVSTLRTKTETLPQSDCSLGLRAVLLHIETAFKHLARGQSQNDEQAFTDAIYRTNQAFEGSIKEAYRVLAGKRPDNKTPFEIENYLADNLIFKPRVLAQFTTYRTQWRNPSTHDYTLAFDESEAFLAITSVSAFACVLIDQIAERLAYQQAKQDAKVQPNEQKKLPDDDEPATLGEILIVYLGLFNKISLTLPITSEAQLSGSLQGFLSSLAPDLSVLAEAEIVAGRPETVDLLVKRNDETVFIELKRSNTRGAVRQGMLHLEHSMAIAGVKESILFLYYPAAGNLQVYRRPFQGGTVHLIVPIAQAEADDAAENANETSSSKAPPKPSMSRPQDSSS